MRAASSVMWVALAVVLACGDADDAATPDDGMGNAGTTAGDAGASGAGGTRGNAGNAGNTTTSAGNGGTSTGGASGGASGGAGGTSTGGAGGAGSSAGSGSAGSGSAGSGSAGTGGALTYDPADHCGPGMYIPGSSFGYSNEADHASTCNDADHFAAGEAGVFEGTPEVRAFIRTVALATRMTAGERYAMSFELDFDGVDGSMALELWGTTARCGMDTTATMMSESVLVAGKQTVCVELDPSLGYTDVLLVLRDQDQVRPEGGQSTSLAGATFCPEGTCP